MASAVASARWWSKLPNGNRGGQDELNRLLGGADRDLFNNIFAFGLGELEAFSSLSGEAVRGRIYGAGTGLGGTSLLDVERTLRAEQDAAYKPRGQEQALPRLLVRIEELRSRIAELEQQPAAYDAARRELADLQARHELLRDQRGAAVERHEHLRRVLEAQAPAARLGALEGALGVPDPRLDALPPDAEAHLERLIAAQQQAQASLATLDESISAAERQRVRASVDAAILAETAEVEALRDERLSHEARTAQRQEAAAAVARLNGELDDQLRRVGGWTEERLLRVDDSIATVERLRQLEQRLVSSGAAAERLEQRLEAARRDLDAADGELPGAELPEDEIVARRAALASLTELRIAAATADERERLSGAAGPAMPRWITVAGAGALLLAAGTLLGGYLDLQPAGSIGGLLLGAVVAAWLAFRADGRPAVEHRDLAARRAELLARAGLPTEADAAAISTASDDLAAMYHGQRAAAQQRARLEERRDAARRLAGEVASGHESHDSALAAWRDWLLERQLPADLSPEAARQVLASVPIVRRLARERDEQLARGVAVGDAAARYDARLDALLSRLGRPLPADASLRPSSVVSLGQEAQRAAAQQRRLHDVDASLAEFAARREPLAEQLDAATASVAAHLRQAGVAGVDELRALAAAGEERTRLRQAMREETATLVALAGSEASLPALLDEAATTPPALLEARREESVAEAAWLEAEQSAALTREGELRGEIGRMEATDELGAARQELALLLGRANETSRQWAVRAVALTLLAETRRRYERERQPQVVRDAQRYFAMITDGRYPRIVAPPGEANVRVEPQTGTPRSTYELSRGTAEQLYLALRFGLIEQFGRSAEPLPVVMDDILVNFDRARAARAAVAVRELATRHQVVFFTCHPQTAELLDPDGVVTLHLD